MSKPEMLLWLSDNRGIYIPRDFAASFADRTKQVKGVTDENWAILDAGPDHEWYWEAWDDVLQAATVTDENGVEYFLNQEGDLWLVPKGMEWSDKDETFHWAQDETKDAE
jgi:hypothetical protein